MRRSWMPSLLVVSAFVIAGCPRLDDAGGGSTTGAPIAEQDQGGGPDESTRVRVRSANGEERSFVRGPLYRQYVTPEALRMARRCLREKGMVDEARIDWAVHAGASGVRGMAVQLQEGVPNSSMVISFHCPGGEAGAVWKLPGGSPLAVPTEPKIPFEEAARAAIPVLQRGYSWLRRGDYVVDLAVVAHPASVPQGRITLAWVVGRSAMPPSERVAVDASTGAVLHGGPTQVSPTVVFSLCDMPAGEAVCEGDQAPACAQVDTGTRCAMAPCPEVTKEVDARNACEACAIRGAAGYWNTKCADVPKTTR